MQNILFVNTHKTNRSWVILSIVTLDYYLWFFKVGQDMWLFERCKYKNYNNLLKHSKVIVKKTDCNYPFLKAISYNIAYL